MFEEEEVIEKKPSEHDEDIKWLMSSEVGRRIAWRIVDRAGVFRISFNTNALAMAFSEGCRNEGLKMIMDINRLCPELYQQMVTENING